MASSAKPATRYLSDGEPGRIWRRSQRRRYDSKPRRHQELVVLAGLQGRMRYFIDGTLVDFGPGSLLFAHSDQSHFLMEDTPDFDMIVVVIAPEMLQQDIHPTRLRAARSGDGPDPRVVPLADVQELSKLADSIIGDTRWPLLSAGLTWWLCRAWHHWQRAEFQHITATHAGVAFALAEIRSDPAKSLSAIAEDANLSLSRLGQAFKNEIGMTMQQYRTRHRLELVEQIMQRDQNASLLTASMDAGFGDYSRFYRAYHAAHGRSPREAFKKQRSDA